MTKLLINIISRSLCQGCKLFSSIERVFDETNADFCDRILSRYLKLSGLFVIFYLLFIQFYEINQKIIKIRLF